MTHKKSKTTYLVPSTLGMGLVEGYDAMNFSKSLCKPLLRRETEEQLAQVASGVSTRDFVIKQSMHEYAQVYSVVRERIATLAEVRVLLTGMSDV